VSALPAELRPQQSSAPEPTTLTAVADIADVRTHNVVLLVQPSVVLLDLAAVQEVLAPSHPDSRAAYRIGLLGTPGLGLPDEGLQLCGRTDTTSRADTLIVPGVRNPGPGAPAWALAAVHEAAGRGARVVGLGTGVFLLAEAGILDGRRATTHWRYAERLRRSFPRVNVEPAALFVQDGPYLTSGGLAAAIDVCLELVRQDHGVEVANRSARAAVAGAARPGDVPQVVDRPLPADTERGLAGVRAWMLEHLEDELSVDVLAARAFMSRRQFTRVFRAETGTSAWRWLLAERLREARRLLESTGQPVEMISQMCGFPTPAAFRVHFRRETGMTPSAYRASRAARCPV
jgi:transcriptional regulator GlxA family with amidase domain